MKAFLYIQAYFKKASGTSLVKVSGLTGISTIIKIAANFVSSKVIALYAGPAGIAMLGQLTNLVSILLPVSTGAINTGVVKYTSEYKSSPSSLRAVITTGTLIIVSLSAITSLAIIGFADYWTMLIFHSIEYKPIIYLIGGSTIFYALNNFFLSLINGFGNYRTYVVVNIVSSIFSLVLTVSLSVLFKIWGALVAYILTQSAVFFFSFFYIRKYKWAKLISLKDKFNRHEARKLFAFSMMALTSAAVVPTAQIFVRNTIIERYGIDQAGLWEAMNRISSMYLMLVTTSISVYYLPKLSSITNKSDLKKEIIQTAKLLMPLCLVLTLGIYVSRTFIIDLTLSESFRNIESYFKIQLLGDLFKIASWLLAFVMVSKAMTFLYIITEIIFSFLYILLSLGLLPSFGIEGVIGAYTINYFLFLIFLSIYFYRYFRTHEPN